MRVIRDGRGAGRNRFALKAEYVTRHRYFKQGRVPAGQRIGIRMQPAVKRFHHFLHVLGNAEVADPHLAKVRFHPAEHRIEQRLSQRRPFPAIGAKAQDHDGSMQAEYVEPSVHAVGNAGTLVKVRLPGLLQNRFKKCSGGGLADLSFFKPCEHVPTYINSAPFSQWNSRRTLAVLRVGLGGLGRPRGLTSGAEMVEDTAMKMRKTLVLMALLAAGGSMTSACTPTQATRGNMLEDYRIAEVVPGVSSRTNVLQSLGSPTTQAPFDENVWYYIGQKTEKRGIFDPKVVEKKVVVVAFNQDGVVDTIEEVDADQINVPTVRRKTPTSGNDITVMEQLIGNIGRFNKSKGNAATTAGGGGNL